MTNEVTVNSRKYDGTLRRSWKCELKSTREGLIMLVGVFDRDVEHNDLGSIRNGTISHEFFFLNSWFNIFRFHEPDGSFRNFYCNITMPPVFSNGVLDYVDLDIDVVVWPDFRYQVLDQQEFSTNAAAFGYSDAILNRVEDSLSELIELIENREFPFDRTSI